MRWSLIPLSGDVAGQYATERVMAREGVSREETDRETFVLRAQRLQGESRNALQSLFDSLNISSQLDDWPTDSDVTAAAARVAFVRLYEGGLLTRTDTVLSSCPSCETVVDTADADPVEIAEQVLRLRLDVEDGDELFMDVSDPEMLIGAVAVAVPVGDSAAGKRVHMPLLEQQVPVISVEDLEAPRAVVPSHDPWGYSIARQLNYPVAGVIDNEGVVRAPGAFEGLSRFAARSAATEELASQALITESFDAVGMALRCHLCATVLVPVHGQHWLLSFKALVDPLLEQIQAGAVDLFPTEAGERLVEAAQAAGYWCVSQQLLSGQQIPVFTCLDCGQTTVSVDVLGSCPTCMGTLQQDSDVLDARFVAAVTPLVMTGWPYEQDASSAETVLSVGRSGLDTWALPMLSLAFRLSGQLPFGRILTHQFAKGVAEQGKRSIDDLVAFCRQLGPGPARVALLLGDFDVERASEIYEQLMSPAVGTTDLASVRPEFDEAIARLDAGHALLVLSRAASEGVEPGCREELARMLHTLLGR